MIEIRLIGASGDVDRLVDVLEATPAVNVVRVSPAQSCRAAGAARRYVDVALTDGAAPRYEARPLPGQSGLFGVYDRQARGWGSGPMSEATATRAAARYNRSAGPVEDASELRPAVVVDDELHQLAAAQCPAAHFADPDPCEGPVAVRVDDGGADSVIGCVRHAARLLAAVSGATVHPLPGHSGSAIEAFKLADRIRSGGAR